MCSLAGFSLALDPTWVSAVATAVSVGVTAVLALITWFYMKVEELVLKHSDLALD